MAATTRVHDTSAIRAKLLEKMGELATDNFPEAIAQNFPHILARLADLVPRCTLEHVIGRPPVEAPASGELYDLLAATIRAQSAARSWV